LAILSSFVRRPMEAIKLESDYRVFIERNTATEITRLPDCDTIHSLHTFRPSDYMLYICICIYVHVYI